MKKGSLSEKESIINSQVYDVAMRMIEKVVKENILSPRGEEPPIHLDGIPVSSTLLKLGEYDKVLCTWSPKKGWSLSLLFQYLRYWADGDPGEVFYFLLKEKKVGGPAFFVRMGKRFGIVKRIPASRIRRETRDMVKGWISRDLENL